MFKLFFKAGIFFHSSAYRFIDKVKIFIFYCLIFWFSMLSKQENIFSSSAKYVENPDPFQSFFGKKPYSKVVVNSEEDPEPVEQVVAVDEATITKKILDDFYIAQFQSNIVELNIAIKELLFSFNLDFLKLQWSFFRHLEKTYALFTTNRPTDLNQTTFNQYAAYEKVFYEKLNTFLAIDTFKLSLSFNKDSKTIVLSVLDAPLFTNDFYAYLITQVKAMQTYLKTDPNLTNVKKILLHFENTTNWSAYYGKYFATESLGKSINTNWLALMKTDLSNFLNLNLDDIVNAYQTPEARLSAYNKLFQKIFKIQNPQSFTVQETKVEGSPLNLTFNWSNLSLKDLWDNFNSYLNLKKSYNLGITTGNSTLP